MQDGWSLVFLSFATSSQRLKISLSLVLTKPTKQFSRFVYSSGKSGLVCASLHTLFVRFNTGLVTGPVPGPVTSLVTGSETGPVTSLVTGSLTGLVTGLVTGPVTCLVNGSLTGPVTGLPPPPSGLWWVTPLRRSTSPTAVTPPTTATCRPQRKGGLPAPRWGLTRFSAP